MNHAERYETLIRLSGKEKDHDYQAACYLLASSQELYDIAYKNIDTVGINFDGIKKSLQIRDENIVLILAIAENLFFYESEITISPYDISRLGYPYMELVCKAILTASGEFSLIINRDSNSIELDDFRYRRTVSIQARIASLGQSQRAEIGDER